MQKIIEIELGDSSGDGHDKTSSFFVSTTRSADELISAYELGCREVGIGDFINKVATEYGERKLPYEIYVKLLEAGFDPQSIWDIKYEEKESGAPIVDQEYYEEAEIGVDAEEFFKIWLFLVNKGKPYTSVEAVKLNTIYIGGYGLFA